MHDATSISLSGRSLLGKAWALSKPYWSSEERWTARALLVSIIGMALFIASEVMFFSLSSGPSSRRASPPFCSSTGTRSSRRS